MRRLIAAALLAGAVTISQPQLEVEAGVGPFNCVRQIQHLESYDRVRTWCWNIQPYHCQRVRAQFYDRAHKFYYWKYGPWRCTNGDKSTVVYNILTTAHITSNWQVVTESVI
jgi:hypothetical protein